MRKCILALFSLMLLAPSLLHAACNPQFSWTQAPAGNNLLRVSFTNTTATTFPPGTAPHFTLYFGDNTSQSNFNSSTYHAYPAPGTYNAMLRIELHDSINPANTCIDTIFHQVTVGYTACASTVSTVANGNGSYTFTANTPAGTSGMAYTWNFGDGTTGSGNPVTHSYTSGGNYTVTLHATGGGCTYNNEQHVQYFNNICDSLHASFGYTQTGTTVQFSSYTNTFGTMYISNISWLFGDGGSATQYNPTHTYATPGTYPVTMMATWTDSLNPARHCHDSIIQMVTIGGPTNPCDSLHANFGFSISGSTVYFVNMSNSTSTMSTNDVLWYFGDGTTSNQYHPTHNFPGPGTYSVTLINSWIDSMTMTQHCRDSVVRLVTIAGTSNPCDSLHANFGFSISGSTVYFVNMSNSTNTMSTNDVLWYFGDGTTSNQYHPTHNFPGPGTYSVTLINSWIDSMTMTQHCRDSVVRLVTIAGAGNICDSLHANFGYSLTGPTTLSFSNASTALPGVPLISTYWSFGDGTSSSQYSPAHTYAGPGTYPVLLVSTWADSLTFYCRDSVIHWVTINGGGGIPCDSLHAGFSSSVSGYNVSFSNTSTAFPGVPVTNTYWNFGDGSTSVQYSPTHTYTAPGTYTVFMSSTWADSMTTYCQDSVVHLITISGNPANNEISGNVYFDSMMVTNPTDSFKIWLIRHDTTANTLTAVDSVYRGIFNAHYGFHNKPAGLYLVKAAVTNQTTGSFGWIPTYHYSSPYWGGATTIVHNGGATLHKDILMLTGTVPSGPGFVGGNISSGAGRGTNTGVPHVLVLLRSNSTNNIIATYTNNDGDYAFDNVPEGAYDVYPEAMSYRTTPSAVITISAGSSSSSGNNNFQQTEDEIIPTKVLGISKLTREDGITIYPNPVAQTLFLECKNNRYTQLTVINVLGQVVQQQTLHTGNNSIDMARLSTGAYYLILKGNEGTRSLQISKK